MKPPNDNASKQPLDFAELGIEAEERKARKRLQEDLQATFDALDTKPLTGPKAYVKLFPLFTSYAQTVFGAYCAEHLAGQSDPLKRLIEPVRFRAALTNHIAPSPKTKVSLEVSAQAFDPKTGTTGKTLTRGEFYRELRKAEPWTKWSHVCRVDPESGEVLEDDEEEEIDPSDFIEPNCLWEEVLSECTEPPTVNVELPDYLDTLVYVMRDEAAWDELRKELDARIKPGALVLHEPSDVQPAERQVVEKPSSNESSLSKQDQRIRDEVYEWKHDAFQTSTDPDILAAMRKKLSTVHGGNPSDNALRMSLKRIRKYHRYPLSGQVKKKTGQ